MDRDGVIYASKAAVSAVAERLQGYRGLTYGESNLYFKNYTWAIASFELLETTVLLDFTNPKILAKHEVNPLDVATKDRRVSQRLALKIYDQGAAGFLWWSSIEPSWTNASLFESRVLSNIVVEKPIKLLTITMPEMIEAAKKIGVQLK